MENDRGDRWWELRVENGKVEVAKELSEAKT